MSGPELPVIYENPRFDKATPTLWPVFDRAIRFTLVILMEWGTLTLIEEAPRYVKLATVVVAALGLAVHESWPWLRMRDWRWYPALMGTLIVAYLGIFFYALYTEPPHKSSRQESSEATAAKPSREAQQVTLCTDGPCAPLHLKPGPEYLKDIALGVGGPEPLTLLGTPSTTGERLVVAVDYSEYRNGWMPKTRAFIGEIKEPLKDKREQKQLLYYAIRENVGTNKLWWGDPLQNHPLLATGIFNGAPQPAILVRGRVAISGSKGEQHHYFMLIRGTEDSGTQVGIIGQYELGDWIESWEAD